MSGLSGDCTFLRDISEMFCFHQNRSIIQYLGQEPLLATAFSVITTTTCINFIAYQKTITIEPELI